jgi:Transposase IS66 family
MTITPFPLLLSSIKASEYRSSLAAKTPTSETGSLQTPSSSAESASTKSTVAKAALDRIAQFYAIEDKARFAPPDERLAHRTPIIPLLDAFFTWAQTAERKLSARRSSPRRCATFIKRRTALTRFATDARLEAIACRDTGAAERLAVLG